MAYINFINEDVSYLLKNKKLIKAWITNTVQSENQSIEEINIIFASDKYIHSINNEYLKHDTYTDIITFQYNEINNPIHSDLFISLDRVKENAQLFNQRFTDELHRILIHGTLHLVGYHDKKQADKLIMTSKEDYYLSLRPEQLQK